MGWCINLKSVQITFWPCHSNFSFFFSETADDDDESSDSDDSLKNTLTGKDSGQNLSTVDLIQEAGCQNATNISLQEKMAKMLVCCGCLGDRSDDVNEIVECDGCGITVHEGKFVLFIWTKYLYRYAIFCAGKGIFHISSSYLSEIEMYGTSLECYRRQTKNLISQYTRRKYTFLARKKNNIGHSFLRLLRRVRCRKFFERWFFVSIRTVVLWSMQCWSRGSRVWIVP